MPAELDDGLMGLGYLYRDCTLCPRECHADRTRGQLGYCGASDQVRIARAALHYWEEPPISGDNGSGTVFFAHCPLQCAYCQNEQISRRDIDPVANPWVRRSFDAGELADIFLALEARGANNINLVTAVHYTPTVIAALRIARDRGLAVPIVYNTGGYEKVGTLRLYRGLVDVYLADYKHIEPAFANRYSRAPDYPQVVERALAEMVGQTGSPWYEELPTGEEVMVCGTIVRHLMLPGGIDESERIVQYLGSEYGDRVAVSLMSQYVPMPSAVLPELCRRLDPVEYGNLVDHAMNYDFDECFIQEPGAADACFIPPFDGELPE